MINFHFLTGLPRAGTTLMASMLRQNPWFYSHIESPTGAIWNAIQEAVSARTETGIMINDASRQHILHYMMHGFYSGIPDVKEDTTIFDNNRKWANNIPAIHRVFPDAHVFALVRPTAQVVESLERAYAENPLHLSVILRSKGNTTVYQRVQGYMDPDTGLVGWALNALRSGYYGVNHDRLHFITYDEFVKNPQKTLGGIHAAINAPPFQYDPVNIEQIPGVEEFDRKIGAPGLHRLGKQVKHVPEASILPPDLLEWLHGQHGPWER